MKRALLLVAVAVLAACIHGPLSWSPDGKRFVFAGLLEDDRGQSDRGGLYVFDVDDGSVTRPVVSDVGMSTPVFLDDSRILYAVPSTSDRPTVKLMTVDRETKRRRPLCFLALKGPGSEEDVESTAGLIVPSLSEDRTRAVFSVVQAKSPPLVLLADLLSRTVTVLPAAGMFPSLSPDGERVTFLAMPGAGTSVLEVGPPTTHAMKGVIDLSGFASGADEPRVSGLAVYDVEREQVSLPIRWKGRLDAPVTATNRAGNLYALAGRRGVVLFDLETKRAQELLPKEELRRVTFARDDRSLMAVLAGRQMKELAGALVRIAPDGGVEAVYGGAHTLDIAAFGLAPDRRTFATVHTHPKVRDPLAVLHDLSTGRPARVLLPELDSATDLVKRWSFLLWGAEEAELLTFDRAFKMVEARVGALEADDENREVYATRLAQAREGRFQGR